MGSIYKNVDNQRLIDRINQFDKLYSQKNDKQTVDQFYNQVLMELNIAFGNKNVQINEKRKLLILFLKNYYYKSFFKKESHDFYTISRMSNPSNDLKKEIVNKIERLGTQGRRSIMTLQHPFWGKMTHKDWDFLLYGYIDKRLEKFGV